LNTKHRKVIIDVETNGLKAPFTIHVIVCRDIETDEVFIFESTPVYPGNRKTLEDFRAFTAEVDLWIGHNIIYFDYVVLRDALVCPLPRAQIIDTLVLSQLLDTGREGGHSLEAWGLRLKHPKQEHDDWATYSLDMCNRCISDTKLNLLLYKHLTKICNRNPGVFDKALDIELKTRFTCLEMHEHGFPFKEKEARELHAKLSKRTDELLKLLQQSFPPSVEYVQLVTKLKEIVTPFNPGSPKQVVDRLWEAGWSPIDKTKTHEKQIKTKSVTERSKRYGWKINETNLSTLPAGSPEGFDYLLEYIIVKTRKSTLNEWLDAYSTTTGCVHGDFNPLGTRTQRCVHSKPNVGNVATAKSIKFNSDRLRELAISLGKDMRRLWSLPDDSSEVYLVGTDMESAHLRIFAHLINEPDFTLSLISGDKKHGTDPHSLNKRALGDACIDRDRAKTFIFSYLNGGTASIVSKIFSCSWNLAQEALDKFIRHYPGLARLKETVIPSDAARGYFVGIDGRYIINSSEHHMIGMYLQSMESILMKYANQLWREKLDELKINYRQINWIHDEFVTIVYGSKEVAEEVGNIQSLSIKEAGEMFQLRCPMGGESKIGRSWYDVH